MVCLPVCISVFPPVMVNFMSTWLSQGVTEYLVTDYSGCVCEGMSGKINI